MKISLTILALIIFSVARPFAQEGSPVISSNDKDDARARTAFSEAYKVFMHPRCVNCHPAVMLLFEAKIVVRMPRSVCDAEPMGEVS
jgi:hypothetical protein